MPRSSRVSLLILALTAGSVLLAYAAPKHSWKPDKAQLEAARKIGQPVVFTNTIGMKFVLIPAGSFMMGSGLSVAEVLRRYIPPPSRKMAREWLQTEHPRHRVVIGRAFYLQTTEVTQAQYRRIMGKNPSHHKGCDQCPVEQVSWKNAREFIRRLNAREKTNKYRLPTEAEWEYACRAGTGTVYSFGDDDDLKLVDEYAWYRRNSGITTHPVGRKKANAWGLYDMHGNVLEWCQDRYARDYYRNSPTRDPPGPSFGGHRVQRGGACQYIPGELRSARRFWDPADQGTIIVGFRVVRIN